MTGKLRHLGSGSYVIHGVDEAQVAAMSRALVRARFPRGELRGAPAKQGEPVTITERSHPGLFALLAAGRAQFSLCSPCLSDIDSAEADAAHLNAAELVDKYGFLALAKTYSGFSPRGRG
jgi:hypothetical protein